MMVYGHISLALCGLPAPNQYLEALLFPQNAVRFGPESGTEKRRWDEIQSWVRNHHQTSHSEKKTMCKTSQKTMKYWKLNKTSQNVPTKDQQIILHLRWTPHQVGSTGKNQHCVLLKIISNSFSKLYKEKTKNNIYQLHIIHQWTSGHGATQLAIVSGWCGW